MFKKIFVSSMIFTILCWSFGIAAINVAFAATLSAGDLIKASGAAVYYYGDDGKRYVFPTESTYMSWYADFSDVKTITDAELAAIDIGGNATVRPGTKLVKINTDPKTYAVSTGGVLRHVDSEVRAVTLYGADWNTRIVDIPESFWVNYTAGDAISSDFHPDGALVKYADASTVYLIEDGVKRAVTGDGFTANRFKDADIITIADAVSYSDGAGVTEKEASANVDGGVANGNGGTGGLSIALASDTPATGYALVDSDGVLYTKATFTANDGDVTVTGMKINRSGLGEAGDFDKVWIVVDGKRRGSAKGVNTSDEVSLLFSSDAKKVVIEDGTSETFEIWASVDTTNSVGTASNALGISEVTTVSNVSGLPVVGNAMANSTAEAPDVEYDDQSVGSDVNIGDVQVEVAKIKFTNKESNEDAIVRGVVFQSDSPVDGTRVGTDDVTNYTLYDNSDNVVAGPVSMDADNYVRFTFNSPFTVEKGGSKSEIFTVKADIISGPGYIVTLDIDGAYDLDIVGSVNGYSTDNTSATWAKQEVTIGNAALSVNVDTVNNPLTRTLTDDTNDIVLLAGNLRADQGDITISQFVINLTGNDLDDAEYTNLRFYVDGVLIGEDSTVAFDDTNGDDAGQDDTAKSFTFDDEINVSGTMPFEVKIDAESAIDANDWIRAEVSASNITATRDSDNATVDAGDKTGTATGNKVTFGAATVQVTASASAPNITRVKGSAGVVFAAFDITVGTASDVTLKSIKLAYGSNGTADQNDLQNITLLKSDMTVWQEAKNLNATEQVTFSSLSKSLLAGSSMRFYVKADIASTINDAEITRMWLEIIEVLADDANSEAITVTDGTSEITDTNEVNDDGVKTKITVADSGTLSVELSSATPDTFMAVTGSTGNIATEYKLRAQYENVNITKLVATTVATSTNDDEIAKVYLYKDGSKLAETSSIVSGVATFNFAAGDFMVPAGESVVLQFRTDINTSNDSLADTGATIQFGINDFNADIEAQGTSATIYPYVYKNDGTGVTLTSNATAAVNATTTDSQTTIIYDDLAVGTIDVGNLIKIGSEYMLVTANSGTVLTVVRGVADSTAAIHNNDVVITEYDQKVLGNTILTYANYPVMSSPTQPTGGQLNTGIHEALKFTVNPVSGAEEDLRLADLRVKIDGQGMSTSTGQGWYITNAWLYNGTKEVGSVIDTDLIAAGDITFIDLENDVDGIVTSATTFTVKVEVALGSHGSAEIAAGDFMRASIDSFGSADSAGGIANNGSDLYWVDMEGATIIEWIDTSLTEIKGPEFNKTT